MCGDLVVAKQGSDGALRREFADNRALETPHGRARPSREESISLGPLVPEEALAKRPLVPEDQLAKRPLVPAEP